MTTTTNNEDLLAPLFGLVYEDILKRNSMPYAIVFQRYGDVYNLTFFGGQHSINLAPARQRVAGQLVVMALLQGRKPKAANALADVKHLFRLDEVNLISFAVSYYFLGSQAPVDMAELKRCYPELGPRHYERLMPVLRSFDTYLHGNL